MLKEHQAGLPVADLCRKHGISDATFYNWRSRLGGMISVPAGERLRLRLRPLSIRGHGCSDVNRIHRLDGLRVALPGLPHDG